MKQISWEALTRMDDQLLLSELDNMNKDRFKIKLLAIILKSNMVSNKIVV